MCILRQRCAPRLPVDARVKSWFAPSQPNCFIDVSSFLDSSTDPLTQFFGHPVYRLLLAHHKNMKSTNMLERLDGESRRPTRVIRIVPNEVTCL